MSDDETAPPQKRMRLDSGYEEKVHNPANNSFSDDEPTFLAGSVAYNMMLKTGWTPKEGLGSDKSRHHRQNIIEASDQNGRTGLGFRLEDLDEAVANWRPELEEINLQEHVEWLANKFDDLVEMDHDVLNTWVVQGGRKEIIDNETKFVDPDILAKILASKTIFDRLENKEMAYARIRSNPFETIKNSIFMNRAAVKMANMDAILDEMFTNPLNEDGTSLNRNGLLYFADVCAGPGGFSEYVLWRKKWLAKGFGFTMKTDTNDFKLDAFIAGTPETFEAHYGNTGDGNIYLPENIKSFTDHVISQTETGVHFMMADGGFDVSGKENIQEIMSKQLYLCQCTMALAIVRVGGHFVMKLFDIFTPFSVGLVYLMYKCFQQITIIKPNTSRPANSERYLVCKWKKPGTESICRHLYLVNQNLFQERDEDVEVLKLVLFSHNVPFETIQADQDFFDYIYNSNNRIGKNQIIGLIKIAAYYKNKNLKEEEQAEIRAECLELWKLPDDVRKKTGVLLSDHTLCQKLLASWTSQIDFLNAPEANLSNKSSLPRYIADIHDWYFVALNTTEDSDKNIRTLFMSHGGRQVVMYNPRNKSWMNCPVSIELSPNTLVYGEIVKELQGEGKLQISSYAFHIIDGMILGGTDIRKLELRLRLRMCQIFADALNKPSRTAIRSSDQPVQIRCKQLYHITFLGRFFDSLSEYKLKSESISRLGLMLRNKVGPDQFFILHGLMFLKSTQGQLQKILSKKTNKYYYFDCKTNQSFFLDALEDPSVIYASFKATFQYRRLWKWELKDQVSANIEGDPKGQQLYRTDFQDFIAEKFNC